MNQKLLDDARKAGLIYDYGNYIDTRGNQHNKVHYEKMLAKFAELQIPDGYKLVPIEPSDEILIELCDYLPCTPSGVSLKTAKNIYDALILFSPPINTEVE